MASKTKTVELNDEEIASLNAAYPKLLDTIEILNNRVNELLLEKELRAEAEVDQEASKVQEALRQLGPVWAHCTVTKGGSNDFCISNLHATRAQLNHWLAGKTVKHETPTKPSAVC